MKFVDIDSLTPTFHESHWRPGYVISHYDYRPEAQHIGIKTSTLIDWRGLERRYAVTRDKWEFLCSRYFNTLKNISDAMIAKGHPGDLWIRDKSPNAKDDDNTRYMVYDHAAKSTHWDDHKTIVERGLRDPKYRASIVTGSDAQALLHMRSLEYRAVRVQAHFREALFVALMARLRVYVDSLMHKKSSAGIYCGIEEMIVIVKNDDRQYIIEVDQYGVMKMKNKKVVTTFEVK